MSGNRRLRPGRGGRTPTSPAAGDEPASPEEGGRDLPEPTALPAMSEDIDSEIEADPTAENARLRQRVHFLEAEIAVSGRAREGRMPRPSTDSVMSTSESSKNKPKPERPATFDGSYTPLLNFHNWVVQVEMYLSIYDISTLEYVRYARTYMSQNVQAWMDGLYGRASPIWDDLKEDMIKRYIPLDHEDRVEKLLDDLQQRSTLTDYVEYMQKVSTALQFAKIHVSEARKMRKFISGLKQVEDRKFILQQKCGDLKEIYEAVILLRQAKAMAKGREDTEGFGSQRRGKKALKNLQGKARQEAWDKGLCLGCGQKGHLIADCPVAKKMLKVVKKFERLNKGKDRKKFRRFAKMTSSTDKEEEEKEEEESEEEREGSSDSSSSDSDSEESGNDEAGSQE